MRVVAEAWRAFERQVIAEGSPEIQRREMRSAFYAGAIVLFQSILAIDPGEEPTAADVLKMDALDQELKQYMHEMAAAARVHT